jgi:tetratricopeptide (TPR) repeat protein
MKSAVLIGLWVASMMTATAADETPSADPWIGQRVYTKENVGLRVGGQVVDDEKQGINLAVSGRHRRVSRIYRVTVVNSPWLWLVAEHGGASGWVLVGDVVLYDQAIDYYTAQIRANPISKAYNDRACKWLDRKEYDLAILDCKEAFRIDPASEVAYRYAGDAWTYKKEYAQAIADYTEAIRLDPRFVDAYSSRGFAWQAMNQYDRAIDDYNEVIRLDPGDATGYRNRGVLRSYMREYDKAIGDYTEAIRRDPVNSDAYNTRAWLWATCPDVAHRDGKKAVESATRACELSQWKEPYPIGTLAAACAEAGDFGQAVKWQEKANGLYADAGDRGKGRIRLDLYKAKKPYHEQ